MAETSSPGDAPLYRRVERQVPALTRRMLDRFVEEIPLYALLPREQLDGEIRAITNRNLRLFFATLRKDRPLHATELAELGVSAARRAEERVPLEAVLTAYHLGARIGWEALVAAAHDDERDALLDAAARMLAYVQQVTGTVAAAYLEERQSIYGEERDAVRALASALLNGGPIDDAATRAGVRVTSTYVVMSLRIAPHPDEVDGGVGGTVAARRKLRRVHQGLDEWLGEPVLGLLEPGGGTVLLPVRGEPGATLDRLPDLMAGLARAAGASVVGGYAVAAVPDGLSAAARQSRDVLRLVRDLEREAGAYRLDDVLLEYQLSRPSDAQAMLAGLLDPLDRNPDLVTTLETYLAQDLDRRRTAGLLHVHPNTLDYRLRRIVELTGLDPATSRGLQLLGAALASRRLRG